MDAGGTIQTLYLRTPANTSYAGSYSRAPFTSTQDLGMQTPAASLFVFTGLTASAVAIAV